MSIYIPCASDNDTGRCRYNNYDCSKLNRKGVQQCGQISSQGLNRRLSELGQTGYLSHSLHSILFKF